MIPTQDFGGTGPTLHFAHGNGYPPAAYAPFLQTLTPHYRVQAMLFRPLWPGASPSGLTSWAPLADDLIQFLGERNETRVIGVGHSLGAMVTLAAALRSPELFRAVVLIEPVLFRRRMLFGLSLFRRLGLIRQIHPLIAPALKRQRTFASADEMFARYRQAPVFSRIDDAGLRAYVESMAKPRPEGGVELAHTPEWEAKIYETGPLDLWPKLKNLQPPLLVIRGAQTDTFGPLAAHKLQQTLPGAVLHTVADAGHLVPMEKPVEVGQLVHDFLVRNA